VRDVFLSVVPFDRATTDGYWYLDAIQKESEKHGLLGWLPSCSLICIGTDCAASMTGAGNGLIQKLDKM
jgi:hypothetical protein